MKVTVRCSEVPLHLYQILGGFHRLAKSRALDVRFEKLSPDSPERLPYNMLEVVTEDGLRLILDMNDGYENLLKDGESFIPFYDKLLSRCDLLYKRSFDSAENAQLCAPEKMRRTPPNFLVTVKGNPAHFPVPCDPRREQIKKFVRMLPGSSYYNGHILEDNLFDTPHLSDKPKILFMARLWDPDGDFPGQLTEAMQQERRQINESRVSCIRLLRREFGDRFYGGITPSAFASKQYADVVLEDAAIARKDRYLAFMKTFDIPISTMGLHRSTGWKFAEYIACAKAIVCEPLCYESMGGLADGTNYLSFTDADSCVRRVNALLDPDDRLRMMEENRAYAEKYLRPEAFVRTVLADAGVTL